MALQIVSAVLHLYSLVSYNYLCSEFPDTDCLKKANRFYLLREVFQPNTEKELMKLFS